MTLSPDLVAVLRVVAPDGDEHFVLVDRPVLHIGSARTDCGLVLAGPDVAAPHCTLRWHGNRWVLYDRGAPAGTYINSRRCREPTGLCQGDRISVVHHMLHFTTLPALDLPHVLARLRDRPISWTALRLAPDPPPHTPPRRPRRIAGLAALTALSATLGIAASAREADPRGLAHHLSQETSTEASSSLSEDLSPETSNDVPRDLSPETPPHERPLAARALAGTAEYVSEPPTFELPTDAVGLGRPTDGALLHALQLPSSPDYTVRCPANAHGTTATIGELMHGLASLRNRGYTGELVVGDISRPDGGRYGPHQSHQSGRDVDVWLPIRGGRYDRGCARCGTDLCRPEPDQVDWRATWHLIQSLAERGAIADIFIDWSLHPELIQTARELGVPESEIHRQIQHPVRGRPTLIKHSDGHVHHMHIRFREPSD
jgi:murein endopeptidase